MIINGGRNIKASEFMNHVGGYMVLLDYTDMGMIKDARGSGSPWIFGKS